MDTKECFDYHNEKKTITSVLLCAGLSSRMGQEKAFLPIENESAIIRILNNLCALSEYVVVVTGKNYEAIKEHLVGSFLDLFNVEIVINQDAEKGMFTSIKKGLSQVYSEKPIMLQMIDQPFVPQKIYEDLVDFVDDEHHIFQPSTLVNGQPKAGHPIIFSQQFRNVIIAQPDEENLRDVIAKYKPARKFMEVNDRRILQNLNTLPEFEAQRKQNKD